MDPGQSYFSSLPREDARNLYKSALLGALLQIFNIQPFVDKIAGVTFGQTTEECIQPEPTTKEMEPHTHLNASINVEPSYPLQVDTVSVEEYVFSKYC